MRANDRSGFTLVELLVVVTIIGILIALLLPAVQSARESARTLTCKNNLKQMGLGCLQHLQVHSFFPTGGWGWGWAGEPDRGFTKRQPSGFHFNILPYIEQENLHQMGAGGNMAEGRLRVETPLALFHCPTRRAAKTYPYPHGSPYYNFDSANRPTVIGRSDYAACAGDMKGNTMQKGPKSLTQGDQWTEDIWEKWPGTSDDATGVVFRRSEVKQAHILDGSSNTYVAGERLLNPDQYQTGRQCSNDQGWDLGYDFDVIRWTFYNAANPNDGSNHSHRPRLDRPGYNEGCGKAFGSAHTVGFHMVLADGSAHMISYNIDREIHRRLGNRKDGLPVKQSELQ